MKKLFSLFAAALVVLSASAFTPMKKEINLKAEKAALAPVAVRPMKQHAIKHAPAANAAFTLSATNITATSARVDVVPTDASALYYFDVMKKATYDNILAGAYASYEINSLADYANYVIANNSYGVDAQTYLSYLGSTGADGYDYSSLSASTEYVLYAISVDANYNCVEPSETLVFKTDAKADLTQLTATISVENITDTLASVTVTPTNENDYFWDLLDKATYDSIVAGYYASEDINDLCDYITSYLDYYVDYYSYYGYDVSYADFLVSEEDSYDFKGLEPGTEYVVFAVTYDADSGACVGTAVTYNFTTLGATALENVEAASVNKFVEDGQVVIVKDGVRYNVLGAKF